MLASRDNTANPDQCPRGVMTGPVRPLTPGRGALAEWVHRQTAPLAFLDALGGLRAKARTPSGTRNTIHKSGERMAGTPNGSAAPGAPIAPGVLRCDPHIADIRVWRATRRASPG